MVLEKVRQKACAAIDMQYNVQEMIPTSPPMRNVKIRGRTQKATTGHYSRSTT